MIGIGLQILCDYTFQLADYFLIYAVCVLLVGGILSMIYFSLSIGVQYRLRLVNGVAILLSMVGLGYVITWAQSEKNDKKNHFSKLRIKR
jgi:hypothetical protein